MIERLEVLRQRYNELESLMADPAVVSDLDLLQQYAREHSELRDVVAQFEDLQRIDRELLEAQAWLDDGADEEFKELARDTIRDLEPRRSALVESLQLALVPRDPADEKNAVVEIRAAAGGDEAGLFAAELFRMYSLYAEKQRWHTEIMNLSESGIGGVKEVIMEVKGPGANGRLKYESGVHRVQRVPATETSGRIHTSTATVIVLPEVEEVDVEIRPEDLRVDVYRASGHGGQGVNTTDSAVRITHLPTGVVVTCQNERSQIQNRASAMAVLRARLYDMEQDRRARELGDTRKSQVQTGDRSEKVRTYNFPQDRVTDHRVGLTVHNLPSVMAGNIDAIIDALSAADREL